MTFMFKYIRSQHQYPLPRILLSFSSLHSIPHHYTYYSPAYTITICVTYLPCYLLHNVLFSIRLTTIIVRCVWSLYPLHRILSKILSKKLSHGARGWLSQLSLRLQLRSWSHGLWVRTLYRALCWQLKAWSLLLILCLPLSAPPQHALCLSLPLKNKEN